MFKARRALSSLRIWFDLHEKIPGPKSPISLHLGAVPIFRPRMYRLIPNTFIATSLRLSLLGSFGFGVISYVIRDDPPQYDEHA